MSDNNITILIELDVILDTRLGVLYQHYPELIDNILSNGYHNRKIDKFSLLHKDINDSLVQQSYAQRNKETLKISRCTNFVFITNQLTKTLEDQAITTPTVDTIDVSINIYPYSFTDEELVTLKDMVKYYIGVTTGVDIVNMPLAKITPQYLKDHYAAIAIYHFSDWLKIHHESLLKCRIPKVTFFVPALHDNSVPTDKELTFKDQGKIDPFMALEATLIEFMDVVVLDSRMFSVIETA